jgi:hypothetical protein
MALIVGIVVILASCGGGDSSVGTAPEAAADTTATADDATEDAADDTGGLPSVQLLAVPSGETVDLASFAPSSSPLVLWFWAPH